MLLRPFEETGTELLVALCNQIALMSQIEMNREKLIKEQVCDVGGYLTASPIARHSWTVGFLA